MSLCSFPTFPSDRSSGPDFPGNPRSSRVAFRKSTPGLRGGLDFPSEGSVARALPDPLTAAKWGTTQACISFPGNVKRCGLLRT